MAIAVSERWEAPSAVERPTAAGIRDALGRLADLAGLRPAGWVALGVGTLCLSVGAAFGWFEFVVAGFLAVVTVLLALLFTIGRTNLEAHLVIADRSVVVGDDATGSLLVRNPGTRRRWASRVDLPVGESFASFLVPSLGVGQIHTQAFRIPTQRRGLIQIGPANSVKSDPFALAGRQTSWTQRRELYVHPRTVPLPGRQAGLVHDLEGHASDHLSASDMNFHALRPYVAGDDLRHVHWRSTARAGQLMVRQYEETRMSRVRLALDTGRASYLDEDEFELAVSCVASIALETLFAESTLKLATSTHRLLAVSPTRALDELSLVELGARGGVGELVQMQLRDKTRVSLALVVTGSATALPALRSACARFDIDTRVIGVRCCVGDQLRVRSGGNVSLVQVGSLVDLPRAMRKAME